eukprot:1181294-Prorocentrum_minimum.AAC.2
MSDNTTSYRFSGLYNDDAGPGDPNYLIDGVVYNPVYFIPVNAGFFIGIEPYTKGSTFSSPLSTLQTTLTEAAFADDSTQLLALTGEVVPDENNATTYKAFATTNPTFTNIEMRDLINNVTYANVVLTSDTPITDTTVLTDLEIPNVVDITGNAFPSSA